MLDEPYLWHPIFVHFSVALLTVASVLFLLAAILRRTTLRPQWIIVANWNLWIGFALAVLTALFGWLAFNTVAHDDTTHEAMQHHAQLALSTVGGFGILTLWSMWHRTSRTYPSWGFVGLAIVCCGLLAATGLRGGELVYHYGVAVRPPPAVQPDMPTAVPHEHPRGSNPTDHYPGGDVHVH